MAVPNTQPYSPVPANDPEEGAGAALGSPQNSSQKIKRALQMGYISPRAGDNFLISDQDWTQAASEALELGPNETLALYKARRPQLSTSQYEDRFWAIFVFADLVLTFIRYDAVATKALSDPTKSPVGEVGRYFSKHLELPSLLIILLAICAAYHFYRERKKQNTAIADNNPEQLYELLGLRDLMLDLDNESNAQNRIAQLNQYVQEIVARDPGKFEKYSNPKFRIVAGRVSLFYDPPDAEAENTKTWREKVKEKFRYSLGLLKPLLMWGGLAWWMIFMSAFLFTASYSAATTDLPFAVSMVMLSLPLIAVSILYGKKIYNYFKNKQAKKEQNTLEKEEQADIIDLLQQVVHRFQYSQAAESLKTYYVGAGLIYTLNRSNNKREPTYIRIAEGVAILLPVEIDKEFLAQKSPSVRLQRMQSNRLGKQVMATLAVGALVFNVQQFSWSYVSMFMTTVAKTGTVQGALLSVDELNAIALVMVFIALVYAANAYYETKEKFKAQDEKLIKARALKAENGDNLIAEMDKNHQALGRLLTLEKQICAELRRQGKAIPEYPRVRRYYEHSADVKRTSGPSKYRKQKKYIDRAIFFLGCTQGAITVVRVCAFPGTGLPPWGRGQPDLRVYHFPDDLSFAVSAGITIGVVAVLWASLRLWRHHVDKQTARAEDFCDHLLEQSDMLEQEVAAAQARIFALRQNCADNQIRLSLLNEVRALPQDAKIVYPKYGRSGSRNTPLSSVPSLPSMASDSNSDKSASIPSQRSYSDTDLSETQPDSANPQGAAALVASARSKAIPSVERPASAPAPNANEHDLLEHPMVECTQ